MRLREGTDMDQPAVLLQPFGHQVAGQASMLSVDANTVCKPLIAREHFVYRTLPQKLVPFTPQYKGVLHVHLQDEDGLIRLVGYRSESDRPAQDGFSSEHTNDKHLRKLSDFTGNCPKDGLLTAPCDFSSRTSSPVSSSSEQDSPVMWDLEQPASSSRMSSVQEKVDGEKTAIEDGVVAEKEGTSKDTHITTNSQNFQPLNPWSLSLHTRLLDKMRKSTPSNSGCPFLLLENVVAHLTYPCILDLKVGSRLHGDDASPKKIASQSQKCSSTTSRTLGLRLCGMQVYQLDIGMYKSRDKYFGRTLTETTFVDVLRDFLHNGQCLRRELLQPVLTRLGDLQKCLKELNSYRFYASSLLIMYDGHYPQEAPKRSCFQQHAADDKMMPGSSYESSLEVNSINSASDDDDIARCVAGPHTPFAQTRSDLECTSGDRLATKHPAFIDPSQAVDVRMIDFAHTTHSGFSNDRILHEGPDLDYIKGLENLIFLFTNIQKEATHT